MVSELSALTILIMNATFNKKIVLISNTLRKQLSG